MLRVVLFGLSILVGVSGAGFAQVPGLDGVWLADRGASDSRNGTSRVASNPTVEIVISQTADSITIETRGGRGNRVRVFQLDGQPRPVDGRTTSASIENGAVVLEQSNGTRETWRATGSNSLTVTRESPNGATRSRTLARSQ